MYCQLTHQGGGVYGLPVIRAFTRNEVIEIGGHTYKLSDLSEAQRQSAGFASWSEDQVNTSLYVPGAALETLTELGVVKSYPNQTYRPIADLKKDKKVSLASRRWSIANGGTTIGGNIFKTDDSSANEINTALAEITRGTLVPPIKFTSQYSGNFEMSEAQLKGVMAGIVAHRQKARAAEFAHTTAIDALATAAEVANYDYTADIVGSEWPVNPSNQV